jgi:hypothetical protein
MSGDNLSAKRMPVQPRLPNSPGNHSLVETCAATWGSIHSVRNVTEVGGENPQ